MKRAGRGAWVMAAVSGAALFSMTGFASGTADKRCDELMTDLRNGRFDAAPEHFDGAVTAALSPRQPGAVWWGLTEANGKLLSRASVRRSSLTSQDIVIARLKFERG